MALEEHAEVGDVRVYGCAGGAGGVGAVGTVSAVSEVWAETLHRSGFLNKVSGEFRRRPVDPARQVSLGSEVLSGGEDPGRHDRSPEIRKQRAQSEVEDQGVPG